MRTIAVIPARGGSERVPGKNLRTVAGRSLLEWTVEEALRSGVDDVVVSTDCEDTLWSAGSLGANVHWRRGEVAGDGPLERVVVASCEGTGADVAVVLQPTSPLRESRHIDEAISLFVNSGGPVASVHLDGGLHFACTEVGGRAARIHAGRPRTQDVRMLHENGAIYVVDLNDLRVTGVRHTGHFVPYYMDPVSGFDINEPHDLVIADALLRDRMRKRASVEIGEITTLVVDVDGVMTDNVARFGPDGEVLLSFDRSDGMGLVNVANRGVLVMAVSGSNDRAAARRCHELGVKYFGGIHDKADMLSLLGRDWSTLAYIGNDSNDVESMRLASFSAAPADAHESALSVAKYVTRRPGGRGAVREVCDMICGGTNA